MSDTTQNRFTKLDTAGNTLPDDAPDWHAVLDNRTQLIWDRNPAPCGRVKHAEAMKAASEVILCGRPARAPTLPEQESLRDLTKYYPAIDTRYFNCPSSWFWTSTPAANSADCVWSVYFGNGGADWGDRDDSGFVRAMRASEPSESREIAYADLTLLMIREAIAELSEDDQIQVQCIASTLRNILGQDARAPFAFALVSAELAAELAAK